MSISPPPHPKSRKSPQATAEEDADFEEWWGVYPRKIGKPAARMAWNARLKEGVSLEDLQAALTNYLTECEGQDDKFIKHPSTFLGKRQGYEDFLPGKYVKPATASEKAHAATDRAIDAMFEKEHENELRKRSKAGTGVARISDIALAQLGKATER